MPFEDRDYYTERAAEERKLSASSIEPNVAKVHLELAEKYEGLARAAQAAPTLRPGWNGYGDAQPA